MLKLAMLAGGFVNLLVSTSLLQAAPGSTTPASPEEGDTAALLPIDLQPDPSGTKKNRFLSLINPQEGPTALRVTFVSLHHVDPPYPKGSSLPFTAFEGQVQFVGPPVRYVESLSSGVPFYAAALQCAPYYHDWGTIGLLHVSGEAVVPDSLFEVQSLGEGCRGSEADCGEVSNPLAIETSRWGDIIEAPQNPEEELQTNFTDISALVNKFKNAPDSPSKPMALLAGDNERGHIDPTLEVTLTHVSVAVDAFIGNGYPHRPGRCSNLSTRACSTDADCSADGEPAGTCTLCGSVAGGACCHGDGTCDVVPQAACDGLNDRFMGEGEPCSRCCGPSPGCKALTNEEWLDAVTLWPNLDRRDICREALEVPTYNCVAWTIDDLTRSIWEELDLDQDGRWELSEFEVFFARYQKPVVLYGNGNDAVLHTARPLPNNCASSKAGEWIRIRHDRNQIEGGYYGDIVGTYAY